ncbi:protein of unknown function [Pseudomonas sp. JV551A1]|uniref:Uncharacterized protein n=1 Tax=Pseudomonas inefficax TaxID=2078786 RepID=A0AAQ1P5K7_9PSED|nr:protein of unknown function [Pseudomonas sp. JV551A1]SPO59417.1 protein of unknown function [Pseudomonas inefficax]
MKSVKSFDDLVSLDLAFLISLRTALFRWNFYESELNWTVLGRGRFVRCWNASCLGSD